MARTADGREIITVSMYGYEYYLADSEDRRRVFRQPCFLGKNNFGLFKCRKISSYKLNKLNFEK